MTFPADQAPAYGQQVTPPYLLTEADEEKTKALLVGRRITAAETGTFDYPNRGYHDQASGRLTLDDGTQVFVIPNDGGCSCGAGDYELAHLASVDNVITDVRLAAESVPDKYGEGPTSYRVYVFADAVEINAVQIDGDDGNGYYGTGYELFVVPAANDV